MTSGSEDRRLRSLVNHLRALELRFGRWRLLAVSLLLLTVLLILLVFALGAAINYLAPFIYVLV